MPRYGRPLTTSSARLIREQAITFFTLRPEQVTSACVYTITGGDLRRELTVAREPDSYRVSYAAELYVPSQQRPHPRRLIPPRRLVQRAGELQYVHLPQTLDKLSQHAAALLGVDDPHARGSGRWDRLWHPDGPWQPDEKHHPPAFRYSATRTIPQPKDVLDILALAARLWPVVAGEDRRIGIEVEYKQLDDR